MSSLDKFVSGLASSIHSFIVFGGLWLPTFVVFLILFFFLIIPNKKKLNKKLDKIRNIKRGDEVITTSGIYGKIKKMPDDRTVILEIAKDVDIKIKKIKIAEVL
jgi:preprotein translocase subunit YajC